MRETWGSTPQPRSKAGDRRNGRPHRRGHVTEQCEQGAEARRREAAEGPGKRCAREHESDAPEDSKSRPVDTEDAASREEFADEYVSGDGPTEMDASAVADAHSHLYHNATSGAEPREPRVTAARFEELDDFKRRGVYAKEPAAEVLGKTGKKQRKMTTTARSTGRAS